MFAVTPRFGDQSTAATWLKGLQGSRTAGLCQSSTPWRATWGRDDERPHLSWARTKPSAPSPRFQGTLVYTEQMFNLFNGGDKNKIKTNRVHSLICSRVCNMFHSSTGWILCLKYWPKGAFNFKTVLAWQQEQQIWLLFVFYSKAADFVVSIVTIWCFSLSSLTTECLWVFGSDKTRHLNMSP